MSVFDSCKKDRDIILGKMQEDNTQQIEDDSFMAIYILYAVSLTDALCLISRGGLGQTIHRAEQDFLESYLANTIGDNENINQMTRKYEKLVREKGSAK